MTFPHRLQFVLLLICCMQDVLASNANSTSAPSISNTTVTPASNSSTPSANVSTMSNASFSIGTEYSSPDCKCCSNGGTITVTMSCSIKMPSSNDKKCDKDELSATRCSYVTLADKVYRCAEVEKNFPNYEKEYLKPVKECDDVCPASGSVLSSHLVFILSSGLAVGILSQTL